MCLLVSPLGKGTPWNLIGSLMLPVLRVDFLPPGWVWIDSFPRGEVEKAEAFDSLCHLAQAAQESPYRMLKRLYCLILEISFVVQHAQVFVICQSK